MAGSQKADETAAGDPEASGAARPRRGLRLVGGFVGAAVVVVGLGLPWFLSSPERIAGVIQSSLKGAEADVAVERVQIGWLGPTVVEGITFEPRDGSPRPLSIGRVEGDRGLLQMLLSLGNLGRFRVSDLQVDVVFDEEHQSNLQALAAAPQKDDATGQPGREARRAAVSTEIVIEQAVVTVAGPWAEQPWVSKPIDLDAVLEPEPGHNRSHWRVGEVQLLDEAVLDPAVAQGVLSYIAPILANATIVGGRFSLALESASLPVGDPGAGTIAGRMVMHEVDIGPGAVVQHVFSVLPLENKPELSALRISESSDIRFGLADRRVRHEGLKVGVPLPDSGERLDLQSEGSVGLDDRSLDMRLSLPLPQKMPADRPLLQTLAGKTLALSVGGTLDQPEVDMDGTLRTTVQGLLGRMAPAAAGGDTKQANAAAGGGAEATTRLGTVGTAVAEQIRGQLPADSVDPQTADAVVDLVGGILDEVGKRRAARQAAEKPSTREETTPAGADAKAEEEDAAAASSPRGSLLRRILDRVDQATKTTADGKDAEPQSGSDGGAADR